MSTVTMNTSLESSKEDRYKQPSALYTLFFAEMWERFGYYGVRALLVLYMVSGLAFPDAQAYSTYGAYTGLIYTMPIIGGMLADRLFGNRRAIILGSFVLAVGYACLALPYLWAFYIGLGALIVGTGMFKSNVTALLGQLYQKGDPRRDPGFTFFYMGINLGALLSPVICGYVGAMYGWNYGFAVAGAGMLFGMLTFMRGQKKLEQYGLPPAPEKLKEKVAGIPITTVVVLLTFLVVPFCSLLVYNNHLLENILPMVGVGVVGYLLYIAFSHDRDTRNNILVMMVMMLFHTTFFSFFEQAGCTLNLFADRNVDRTLPDGIAGILGMAEFPTAWTQSLNPIFIVLLGGVFAWLWTQLSRRHLDPSSPLKFVLGLIQLGLGFLVFAYGASFAEGDGKVAFIWLLFGYFFHTTGELCISPVGLSMVTKLAPARLVSTLMGIWFLSVAFGNYLAGVFAKLTSVAPSECGIIDTVESLNVYATYFEKVGYMAIGAGFLLLLLTPVMQAVFKKAEKVTH